MTIRFIKRGEIIISFQITEKKNLKKSEKSKNQKSKNIQGCAYTMISYRLFFNGVKPINQLSE